MNKGSKGTLQVDSVCNIGPHYSRTLREWRKRFILSFDSIIAPALLDEYAVVMNEAEREEEIQAFKRKWIYYYCICEAGFATRTLADYIVSFTREADASYGCNVFS
jgi:cyclopropane-fatty-acyl-phospholipid synthase